MTEYDATNDFELWGRLQSDLSDIARHLERISSVLAEPRPKYIAVVQRPRATAYDFDDANAYVEAGVDIRVRASRVQQLEDWGPTAPRGQEGWPRLTYIKLHGKDEGVVAIHPTIDEIRKQLEVCDD